MANGYLSRGKQPGEGPALVTQGAGPYSLLLSLQGVINSILSQHHLQVGFRRLRVSGSAKISLFAVSLEECNQGHPTRVIAAGYISIPRTAFSVARHCLSGRMVVIECAAFSDAAL